MADTILSFDLGSDDCLYRILRKTETRNRVVYVWLRHLDLIPKDLRTYSPQTIRYLSRLDGWSTEWQTLVISKDGQSIRKEYDIFPPHSLSKEQIFGGYDFFDITNLQIVKSTSIRVSLIQHEGKQCFLKIARFRFELPSLEREIKAYRALAQRDSGLAPRIHGYAYEETRDRVVGLILELVVGRHPDIEDLQACQAALQRLHESGIIHGDVNRYNILMTGEGVKFIDFEAASYRLDGQEDWAQRTDEEMQSVRDKLLDESGVGRPWAIMRPA